MDPHHQSYRPRDMRDKTLGAIAYRGAIANGVGVMAATEARIEAQFGEAAVINTFKLRVERIILFGPEHAGVRARYGARAASLRGASLSTAIHIVDNLLVFERQAFQLASALGCGTRLSVEVLKELRLILRWLRFTGRAPWFPSIVNDVC